MFYNDNYRQDNNYGDDIDINIMNNNTNQNVNMNDVDMTSYGNTSPIVEPGRERIVQRNIIHEVKHVCPINTRIINNHIYRHTYEPKYTCCEENTVTNVQCGSCCNYN